ncbi:MAG: hypothetical protein ABI083_14335 [Lapillicoccus sp.]
MRQFSTGLNRTWLAVIGLLLLLSGLLSTAVGTGLLGRVVSGGPSTDGHLLGAWAGDLFTHTLAVLVVGLIALLLGLLGLGWLLAQVPRTNAAAVYRLQDDARTGLTTISPSVLTAAVSTDVRALPEVTGADAVLRGTATAPELTVRVTVNDHADVPALLRSLQAGPAAHLETALEAPLARLAVQVDISPAQRTSDSVTL